MKIGKKLESVENLEKLAKNTQTVLSQKIAKINKEKTKKSGTKLGE